MGISHFTCFDSINNIRLYHYSKFARSGRNESEYLSVENQVAEKGTPRVVVLGTGGEFRVPTSPKLGSDLLEFARPLLPLERLMGNKRSRE